MNKKLRDYCLFSISLTFLIFVIANAAQTTPSIRALMKLMPHYKSYRFITEVSPSEPTLYKTTKMAKSKPSEFSNSVYHNILTSKECCLIIAHAGGAIHGQPYTNSKEAMNSSYKLGRRIFEIDFVVNDQGYILLTHNINDAQLSKSKFMNLHTPYTRLSLRELSMWIIEHKDVSIITDTKGDFDLFIEHLTKSLPFWFIKQHFIFQVYDFKQLEKMQSKYPEIPLILTIYKMQITNDELRQELSKRNNNFALTIPQKRAYTLLPKLKEHSADKRIYVHGAPTEINNPESQARLQGLGASGFYLE